MFSSKLLLFDIDGTLIDTGGAGLISLEEGIFSAFQELSGRAFPALDLGGATDGSVVEYLFNEFGITDHEGNRQLFFDCYLSALAKNLSAFSASGKGRLLNGVGELLEALRRMPTGPTLALLTGNTKDGAMVKLKHFEVDHFFTFGAFGDDDSDRNALGPIALERAEREHGLRFRPEDVVIIGDTIKDIACARAFGAKVIAVATGTASIEQLAKAAPDQLIEDLSNTPAVIEVLSALFS